MSGYIDGFRQQPTETGEFIDQKFDKWLETLPISSVHALNELNDSGFFYGLMLQAFAAGWDANNREPYELG